MIMFYTLITEFNNKYPEIKHLKLLHAAACYYRMPTFRVVVLIRRYLLSNNRKYKNRIRKKLSIKYGIDIGTNFSIGENLKIEHINGIVIGNDAVIGDNCTIYQQVTIGQKNGLYPTIGNNVIIFPGARIIGGINIGDNSIIGTNAVVLHDVPENSVAAGVPAKIIRSSIK